MHDQGWTGRKIQPWHFLSRPAHYIISTRGGTRRTGRTLYIRIIVQFFVFQVCVSCAADKKGVKPEQEVNRHPVVAASPPAISTTKPLLNITHDPTLIPLLQLLVCDCLLLSCNFLWNYHKGIATFSSQFSVQLYQASTAWYMWGHVGRQRDQAENLYVVVIL